MSWRCSRRVPILSGPRPPGGGRGSRAAATTPWGAGEAAAADRSAFAEELAAAVTALVAKYHDEDAEGGRTHRVLVAVHPSIRPRRP